MQDILSRPSLSRPSLYRPRQPQLGQNLATPPIHGRDPLKSGSINQPHAGTCRINAARLYQALPHLCFEPLQIQPDRRRSTTPHRTTLAMDDLPLRLPAVNFVVNLVIVVIRQQYEVDFLALADDDRLRPDGVAQFQYRRFRL